MALLEEYTRDDGHTYEIHETAPDTFSVICWTPEDECHWEVSGVVIGGNGFREQRRPFTREEAFAEFNRWRVA